MLLTTGWLYPKSFPETKKPADDSSIGSKRGPAVIGLPDADLGQVNFGNLKERFELTVEQTADVLGGRFHLPEIDTVVEKAMVPVPNSFPGGLANIPEINHHAIPQSVGRQFDLNPVVMTVHPPAVLTLPPVVMSRTEFYFHPDYIHINILDNKWVK